jgi:uncharacterized membrane protein
MAKNTDLAKEIKLFAITAIALLVIDITFLSLVMSKYFNKQIVSVQGEKLQLNIPGAIICYIFLIVGIYYFIIRKEESLLNAFLLGFFVYGVYEYTSYSLLKKWNFRTTLIDTFWGGILFMLTAAVVYKIKEYL